MNASTAAEKYYWDAMNSVVPSKLTREEYEEKHLLAKTVAMNMVRECEQFNPYTFD